jgi:hypothetical protein
MSVSVLFQRNAWLPAGAGLEPTGITDLQRCVHLTEPARGDAHFDRGAALAQQQIEERPDRYG